MTIAFLMRRLTTPIPASESPYPAERAFSDRTCADDWSKPVIM
jgi:hypothetical protein